ncbi:MAG: NAD(+) synthase [Lachnospiraceae bacterium]|nr:NAD(+) synthase [Lachnospiraceae bacterium]
MQDGFVRVAAVTPSIKVADPVYNREQVVAAMQEAVAEGAKIVVFPELVMTGYTCGDLFLQKLLLDRTHDELMEVAAATEELDALVFVGTPWVHKGRLYNCMAALNRGEVLGLIPKTYIPNYGEFYEKRHFTPGNEETFDVDITDEEGDEIGVPLGTNLLFQCEDFPDLIVAGEVCEDLWSANPPSTRHALAGATVIVNSSASDEATGKAAYRRSLVTGQSGRLICGYIYASAGEGESSQDLVFSGHDMIAENGELLAEATRFRNGIIYGDLDIDKLVSERRRNTCFGPVDDERHETITFSLNVTETKLTRTFPQTPFVPGGQRDRAERCEEILSIQSMGLVKRLAHTGCKHAVIGISGGLDSTLALLVTVRAFDRLNLPREGIVAVTMPCFGTTDRTYRNACRMATATGATLREIPLAESVRTHFRDIGHDEAVHDVTYENGQARERTQVLMDIANQVGGLVIGTGDMSELALGWATYNGDHMSMYGVNVGVPKTLVRHLVRCYADTCGDEALAATLQDVLDTPVSPELLPPEDGKISQKTEDLVGPYELHDFFLYYMLRFGFPPRKIYRLALRTFEGSFDAETIWKWMRTFYRRFFAQQFKRSCLPDGPRVGSVAVSPRGDLRMPSDACGRIWLEEVEHLREED